MSEDKFCRWGIMSTATIGQKNWQAIKNSGNGTLVAVASRNAEKSEQFIKQCQNAIPFNEAPRAIGGYDQLLAADDIDAVYIPLPTGLRKEWVVKAAEAGLHVMCEKPCAASADELAVMIDACTQNGVQFMDGVMYMHTQRLVSVRKAIDAKIGKLKRIATQFSFCGDSEFEDGNIRTNSVLEPFGCLGDLGWYTIRFALWVMNYEMPVEVRARMLTSHKRNDSPDSVPMEIEGDLQFENGISSSFYNSFVNGHQQWAHISGTEGVVHIPDFVLPFAGNKARFSITKPEFTVEDCDFTMTENREDVLIAESADSAKNSQETNLFRKFSEIVISGKLEPHWPDIALKTQQVMDACMQSALENGKVIRI